MNEYEAEKAIERAIKKATNQANKSKLDKAISELRYEEKTLRDEFAMAALTGLSLAIFADNLSVNEQELAKKSYQIADAMLEARKAKGE